MDQNYYKSKNNFECNCFINTGKQLPDKKIKGEIVLIVTILVELMTLHCST